MADALMREEDGPAHRRADKTKRIAIRGNNAVSATAAMKRSISRFVLPPTGCDRASPVL